MFKKICLLITATLVFINLIVMASCYQNYGYLNTDGIIIENSKNVLYTQTAFHLLISQMPTTCPRFQYLSIMGGKYIDLTPRDLVTIFVYTNHSEDIPDMIQTLTQNSPVSVSTEFYNPFIITVNSTIKTQ